MSAIELVVTDLDGTLWDSHERIHDRTLEALRELEARRVPLLVASGRRPRSAAAVLARERLAPPAVLLDGAVGQDLSTGETFHEVSFCRRDAVAVLEAFESASLSPCVYVSRRDVDVVVGEQPSTHPTHLQWLAPSLVHDDLRRVVESEAVFAFGVVGREPRRLRRVQEALDGRAAASVTPDIVLGGSTLMVKRHGVDKWQGVLAYCDRSGIDPHRVLALGNGENDVELLQGARVACVVRDGCDVALALADHVIEPAAVGGWCAVLDLCR